MISQGELEALRVRTEAVVKENDRLHSRLEQGGSGHADYLEWYVHVDTIYT